MHASDLSRARWRKSSYSNGTGGSCVEITTLTGHFREHGACGRGPRLERPGRARAQLH